MLDGADSLAKSSPEKAVEAFEKILSENPSSPRAVYGKARALDNWSAKLRSNSILEEAIEVYSSVLKLGPSVPDVLFRMAGIRCAERMQFRGWGNKAVAVYKELAKRFPDDSKLQNDLGVQYLVLGRDDSARKVFEAVLSRDPHDAFAAVHLGFILKQMGETPELERGVELLKQGVYSGVEGTNEAKFFYHLGDGLKRLGRIGESEATYHKGVELGHFMSFWQRSLYNCPNLRGKPVWNLNETGQEKNFELLKSKWQEIRQEAITALYGNLYDDEAESLRDTGKWRQFTMYSQGRKHTDSCKSTPITCSIIEESFPSARDNKRGQVKFSALYPDTHVHAHVGPTNCRLRAHLGLVVPKGKMELRVADQFLTWKEGEIIVFDESFEHEVWQEAKSERIVLIVDIWHPELDEITKASLTPI